jgi:hypothetical protein
MEREEAAMIADYGPIARFEMPKTLRLLRGNVLLGTITAKPADSGSPWRSGAFHPAAEFENVRGLFDEELRLLKANTADDPAQWDEWESVHAELHDPGMRLEAEDKSYIADDMLIHIDGSEAWWRSD